MAPYYHTNEHELRTGSITKGIQKIGQKINAVPAAAAHVIQLG